MNLLRYIKGLRQGKEAHLIELEALEDAFLSEALEGYEAIDDDHLKRIVNLQKQVKNYTCKKDKSVIVKSISKQTTRKPKINISWKKWGIAITLFLYLMLGGYYLSQNYKSFINGQPNVASKHQTPQISLIQRNTQQDTLIIYMPKPSLPKKKLTTSMQPLLDSLKRDRMDIDIFKLSAPQTPLQVIKTPKSENKSEAMGIE